MKWLLPSAVTLVALWVAYFVVANLVLRSSGLRQRINRHPDRFFLEWTSATTWLPGVFQVRGLHFVGQGTRSVYYGRIDAARFRVALTPLLRREIRAPVFEGAGIEFRLARRGDTRAPDASAEPGDADDTRSDPSIPGLESLPRRTAPRSARRPPSWHLRVDQARMRQIAQIWIHQFRHVGVGELEASLAMQIDGPVHVRLARLEYPSATLDVHGATVARDLFTRANGELGPLTFGVDDEPPERLYEHITVEAEIRGSFDSLDALRNRVGHALRTEFGGAGRVEAQCRVRRGVLQSGTRMRIDSPNLALGIAGITFRGVAAVEDSIVDDEDGTGRARLRLHLDDLVVVQAGDVIATAPGRVLELESTTPHLTLHRPFDNAEVMLRLSPITVTQAAFLNHWIPQGAGVRLVSGHLQAKAEVRAGGKGPGSGSLTLEGQGLAAEVRGQRCQTDLLLEVPMQLGDLGDRRGRIDGALLTLTNVVVAGARTRAGEAWHARFGIPSAEIDIGSKGEWSMAGEVSFAMRDTRPLVAVLVEQEAAPGWIRLMPTLRGLEGRARITAGPQLIVVRDAHVTGASVEMRAELELSPGRTRGIVYAEYGPVGAGFDLRGERSRWRIFGARRWYTVASANPFEAPAPGAEPPDPPAESGGPAEPGRR